MIAQYHLSLFKRFSTVPSQTNRLSLSTWIKAFQMSLDSNSAGSLRSPWPSLLDPLHACPHHGTSVFGRSSHILVLALAISTSLWTLVFLFILCINIHNVLRHRFLIYFKIQLEAFSLQLFCHLVSPPSTNLTRTMMYNVRAVPHDW